MHTPESLGDPDAVDTRGRVRNNDRETSQAAAERLTNGKLRDSQQEVYDALLDMSFGATDDELRRRVAIFHGGKVSKSGPATRRGELERAGWVRPMMALGTYVKRPSDSGQPMIVWEAVSEADYIGPTETAAHRRKRERHERGLAVARRVAGWEIGDPAWAEVIIDAYQNPDEAERQLDEEMGE